MKCDQCVLLSSVQPRAHCKLCFVFGHLLCAPGVDYFGQSYGRWQLLFAFACQLVVNGIRQWWMRRE